MAVKRQISMSAKFKRGQEKAAPPPVYAHADPAPKTVKRVESEPERDVQMGTSAWAWLESRPPHRDVKWVWWWPWARRWLSRFAVRRKPPESSRSRNLRRASGRACVWVGVVVVVGSVRWLVGWLDCWVQVGRW